MDKLYLTLLIIYVSKMDKMYLDIITDVIVES